jgi:protein O-GlcNAc transferase
MLIYQFYSNYRGNELKHFESYDEFDLNEDHCDVIFENPTIIIKLDAAINMFHHFCDFINLYATQFLNLSFYRDIDILWWETVRMDFL